MPAIFACVTALLYISCTEFTEATAAVSQQLVRPLDTMEISVRAHVGQPSDEVSHRLGNSTQPSHQNVFITLHISTRHP
jgi:hypothetical protein